MNTDLLAEVAANGPGSNPTIAMLARVTILLVLALTIHALLGRRRALIRSGLWNAVLLALLLQPVMTLALPRLRIAVLTSSLEAPASIVPGEAGGVRRTGAPSVASSPMVTPSERTDSMTFVAPYPGRISRAMTTLGWLFVAVYATGVVMLSLRLAVSLWAVGRIKRTAADVDDPCWTAPIENWRARMGIARPIRLVRSAEVRVPMVLGWLRPVIVLPADKDGRASLPGSHVDAILLHELAHIRRGDDLWNLVQELVAILYWPHPLMWLMTRLIAGVREQACDDLCVRWVGGADHYRSALIAAASRLVAGPRRFASTSLGLAMARASSSALLRRLRWIERTRGTSACLLPWPGRVAVGLAMLVVVSLLATIEPVRVGAAPPGFTPADDAAVRAYDQPVPVRGHFHIVSLTVLDDATNRPLPDAEIRILNYVDSNDHVFRTDPHGRLRFECLSDRLEPAGHIEVRKDGYVPLRYAWGFDTGPPKPDSLRLRLRRGTTMGGKVVAAANRPVEGVTVVMTVGKYGVGKRADNPTGYESFFEIPMRTGPDGRWRTDGVPPGAEVVNLQLIHPDFVCDGSTTVGWRGRTPDLADLRDQTDVQVLLKGMTISGRVLDDRGRPIAGAEVVDSTRGLTFLDYVWRTSTDAEGRFSVHLARMQKMTLTVRRDGYQPAMRTIVADPDHPAVEFRLPPGKRLRGRVVDPAGHPIEGASILIASFPPHLGLSMRRWADAQGRFEWTAPRGPRRISYLGRGLHGRRPRPADGRRSRGRRRPRAGGQCPPRGRRCRERQAPSEVPGRDRHTRARHEGVPLGTAHRCGNPLDLS